MTHEKLPFLNKGYGKWRDFMISFRSFYVNMTKLKSDLWAIRMANPLESLTQTTNFLFAWAWDFKTALKVL